MQDAGALVCSTVFPRIVEQWFAKCWSSRLQDAETMCCKMLEQFIAGCSNNLLQDAGAACCKSCHMQGVEILRGDGFMQLFFRCPCRCKRSVSCLCLCNQCVSNHHHLVALQQAVMALLLLALHKRKKAGAGAVPLKTCMASAVCPANILVAGAVQALQLNACDLLEPSAISFKSQTLSATKMVTGATA